MSQILNILTVNTPEGQRIPIHYHNGTGWIEATKGQSFVLQIKNPKHTRMKAVVSVDGKDVITGQPASQNGSGYIMSPSRGIDIDGWRTSDKEVAQFYFTNLDDSYSERAGDGTQNCGVVGIALWEEKQYQRSLTTLNSSRSFSKGMKKGGDSTLDASVTTASVGTGFGAAVASQVNTVDFESEPTPYKVTEYRYATREELIARGVISSTPTAWPADKGYCQPPVR